MVAESLFEATYTVAKDAYKLLEGKGEVADKYKDLMTSIEKAYKVAQEKESELYTVFVEALGRDLIDNLMGDLFRLNMLKDQDKLLTAYYALPSRETFSDKAMAAQKSLEDERAAIKAELDTFDAKSKAFQAFQQFAVGRAETAEPVEPEAAKEK